MPDLPVAHHRRGRVSAGSLATSRGLLGSETSSRSNSDHAATRSSRRPPPRPDERCVPAPGTNRLGRSAARVDQVHPSPRRRRPPAVPPTERCPRSSPRVRSDPSQQRAGREIERNEGIGRHHPQTLSIEENIDRLDIEPHRPNCRPSRLPITTVCSLAPGDPGLGAVETMVPAPPLIPAPGSGPAPKVVGHGPPSIDPPRSVSLEMHTRWACQTRLLPVRPGHPDH